MRPSLEQLKGKKELTGVEIGVWRGDNAVDVLTKLDIKMLHLVDPYVPYQDTGNYFMNGNNEAEETKNKARDKLEPFDKLNRIKWYYETSLEAAKHFNNETIDFVYIDGNHQYEYVRDDINAWTDKVKLGGLVSGHDYNLAEVKSAVVEYCVANGYKAYTFNFKKDKHFYQEIAKSGIGRQMKWQELKNLIEDTKKEFTIPQDWWFYKEHK